MEKNLEITPTENILSDEEFLPFVQEYSQGLLSQAIVFKGRARKGAAAPFPLVYAKTESPSFSRRSEDDA